MRTKFIVHSTAIVVAVFAAVHLAGAQSAPQVVITWRSNNFVPSDYRGKTLPVKDTVVVAAVDVLEGGVFANLSNTQINWLVNGKLYQKGVGLEQFAFKLPFGNAGLATIKTFLPNYKGALLEKTTSVPVASPEVVLRAPFVGGRVPAGVITLRATPYFFNVQSQTKLGFSWSANNRTAEGESAAPDRLTLNATGAASGDRLAVSVSAYNASNPAEFARSSAVFEVK